MHPQLVFCVTDPLRRRLGNNLRVTGDSGEKVPLDKGLW